MTAAAYFVLTMALHFLSYREIQFRISEILNLLVFINPVFAPGVVLGCFLANLFSPFGLPDVLFGTSATVLTVFCIIKTRRLWLAALMPVVCNIIVAGEIFFLFTEAPFQWMTFGLIAASVLGGQAAVMYGAGYPLFKFALLKNEKLMEYLTNI